MGVWELSLLSLQFVCASKAILLEKVYLKHKNGDFPGGPVVKTSPSNAGGAALIPGLGAKIPHASRLKN